MIHKTIIRLHQIEVVLVIEGLHESTEELANTDGRRSLDLIEAEFHIPVLKVLLKVFLIKEHLPRGIMTKVESNPQSLILTYVHRFAVHFHELVVRKCLG